MTNPTKRQAILTRKVKSPSPDRFRVVRDATETARQGQGGDSASLKAMAELAASFTPVLGDAMSARDAYQSFKGGDMLGAALGAVGAIPLAGTVGDVAKAGRGLAMDEASRMARAAEQGFTQDVFHATRSTRPIDEFHAKSGPAFHDLAGVHVGSLKAAEDRARQYYGISDWQRGKAKSPELGDNSAPSVMPLKMKADKPFTKKNGEPYSEAELRQAVKRFAQKAGIQTSRPRDAQIAFERHLASQGHDVIPYVNSREDRGALSYLVLRPENLRSRFAAFDPENIGKAGLMGGMAALLAGGAANDRDP